VLGTVALALLLAAPANASAQKRGNTVLYKPRGPVFSVIAAPRLGILFVGGAHVMQRVGFGAGLQFRVHAGRVGPFRFGGELHFGHLHFLQRNDVTTPEGATARRYSALGHTEFALGPSIQIVMGPVFAELGVAAGLGINTLVRPTSAFPSEEEDVTNVSPMLRSGAHIGVPIRNNSSVVVGSSIHKYFSSTQVVAQPDPSNPDQQPDTNPFDLALEIIVGYHFMF
jgi:hypothetical protein